MIHSNVKTCALLLVGLIAMFLYMKNCNGYDGSSSVQVGGPDQTVVVKLTTKIDTVYTPKYVYVVDTIKVPKYIKADTVFIKGTKDVAMIPAVKRIYVEKITPIDSVTVKYTASTTGTLDNIIVEFEDKRAEKTIIATNTSETTITKEAGGLFIGVGANLGLNELAPHVQYVKGKNIFGVKYNVAGTQTPLQNVGITYSRKLF